MRRQNPVSECPLTAAFAAIGGKWKLIIIYWLAEAPRHFEALRRLMPSISKKVLTEQLRELMADDIVRRERTGPVPAPVTYSLTEYGRSLLPIVESIRTWGNGHLERFATPPARTPDADPPLRSPPARRSASRGTRSAS